VSWVPMVPRCAHGAQGACGAHGAQGALDAHGAHGVLGARDVLGTHGVQGAWVLKVPTAPLASIPKFYIFFNGMGPRLGNAISPCFFTF